jgi:hypothetical protein
MKLYPVSQSPHAQPAQWTVHLPDGHTLSGTTGLSFTQPRRALWRLIAHLRKQVPGAEYYSACFPKQDVHCGESGDEA